MQEEQVRLKIRKLTRKVEKEQELLSQPESRLEYRSYIDKDEELFEKISNNDYRSFSLLCEFGSVKALVNEKRYDKIQKQSQSSLIKNILSSWRLKYSVGKFDSQNNNNNNNDSDLLFKGSFKWDNWYSDHSGINIFPFNNIRYNTLKGLFTNKKKNYLIDKKTKIAGNKSKNSVKVKETKFLSDQDVEQTNNLKKLEHVKNELYEKLRTSDPKKKGIEIWSLVLDKNENNGFSNTCYNLFSLLSLLKESKIVIDSPSATISNEVISNVLVRIGDSEITPNLEKNTGIISNFSFNFWKELSSKLRK
ncbi:hypothetical protein FG386_000205 [Cryptosporidium ryanae]|uniref:uncharacterized protein n=1 Tax=Cryptosporidium ryanae TaxID=515981 RepID=UPI00351A927C|nr:hypothetical protein FG386_000205 [Cryptosporidium ryanae]